MTIEPTPENPKMDKFRQNFARIPGAQCGGGVTNADGVGRYFLTVAAETILETLAYLKKKRVKIERTASSREPGCIKLVLEFPK